MALDVQNQPIDKLIPYARNARTHSPEQVAEIAASIKEFGFNNPVLLRDDFTIIAGHGRVLAARKLGMDTVPAIFLSHLTEAQARAYVLADNQLATHAGWEADMLKLELDDLSGLGFDPELLGFSDADLAALLVQTIEPTDVDAEPQVDRAEELRVKWGVETGQLWRLGEHRILCGDSTLADDVTRALDGAEPLLMVTDPPYGVEYDADWRNHAKRADGTVIGGAALGKVRNDGQADWREAWALFPGDVAYVWHAPGALQVAVAESLVAAGFECRNHIIWAKNCLVIGRGHYHQQHEPCWYAVRKGGTGHWQGDRTQSTLWAIDKPRKSETGHSTQKPVECMARPIRNHDSEFVYEPFSGSGTTIIACEQLGRKCRAIEISPGYVAVAIQRWADATGGTPELIDG